MTIKCVTTHVCITEIQKLCNYYRKLLQTLKFQDLIMHRALQYCEQNVQMSTEHTILESTRAFARNLPTN